MTSKVVVTRNIGPDALAILQSAEQIELVLWEGDSVADRDWLIQNATGAVGLLVTLSDKVDEELVSCAGPSLQVISTMSVGYEHVNIPLLQQRGIKLGYTPEVLTDAVADIGIMLALMVTRNAAAGMDIVRQGLWSSVGWSPFGFCGPHLGLGPSSRSAYTAGFLGFGRIAQATLHRLVPFGVTHVIYHDSGRGPSREQQDHDLVEKYAQFGKLKGIKRVSLEELATESDIIFLLLPGGQATHHIVGERFLRLMKSSAVLINPGRGSLVDPDALALALGQGWIYGAGLDVLEHEPNISAEHPLVKSPRAVILPHIGSATYETRKAMASLAAQNLLAGVKGEDLPVEFKLISCLI